MRDVQQLELQPARPGADTAQPLPSHLGQIHHGLGRDAVSGHENIPLQQPEHTLTGESQEKGLARAEKGKFHCPALSWLLQR